MWCPDCQSDTPHSSSTTAEPGRCFRCGSLATAHRREKPTVWHWHGASDEGLDLGAEPTAIPASSRCWDDWTLAAEVRRARNMLARAREQDTSSSYRYDAKSLLLHSPATASDLGGDVQARLRPRKRHRGWRIVSFAVLGTGALAFGYGIAVAASLVNGVAAVARLGVPLMLAGLFGLILDLLLQVIAMRRDSSAAVDRMRLVELRLQEYRQAALLVGGAAPLPHARGLRDFPSRGARLDDYELGRFELVAKNL